MSIGINLLQGTSPDNALAWVQATKPRYCVVINEPSTAARLQAHTQVVYRVKSASDDDHALDYDPAAFVQRRHLEAPPGALIALSNEPGRGSLASPGRYGGFGFLRAVYFGGRCFFASDSLLLFTLYYSGAFALAGRLFGQTSNYFARQVQT